jgi:heme oxygenase (mycobilin-producing)
MIRIVKLTFKEEKILSFQQFFEQRKEHIRNFEGCTHLALWQDAAHENIFYTYSLWESEDHLNRYRTSSLFQETWSQVKQWFSEKPMAFSAHHLINLP